MINCTCSRTKIDLLRYLRPSDKTQHQPSWSTIPPSDVNGLVKLAEAETLPRKQGPHLTLTVGSYWFQRCQCAWVAAAVQHIGC